MLGFAAISETAISEVPTAATPPAPEAPPIGGGSPYIEAPRINVAALDDDLLLV